MQHYTDFSDFLPTNSSRGLIIVRNKEPSQKQLQTSYERRAIPGRYLDPVSSRFDQLSQDEYLTSPVPTYLKGKSDFVYKGQKPGYLELYVPKPPQNKSSCCVVDEYKPSSSWKVCKIEAPVNYSNNGSCYTNLPANY